MSNALLNNIGLLLKSLVSDNEETTQQIIFDIKRSQYRDRSLLNMTFPALLDVMASKIAIKSNHSHILIFYFESSFRLLDDLQKKQLLSLIKSQYALYQDWMTWFSFSEILGEQFSNRASLHVAQYLKRRVKGKPKIFIPHAFEHHVTDSKSMLVQAIALHELKSLQRRQSLDVIREAKISLRRIKHRKQNPTLKHIKNRQIL